jgi:exodeoxyribonuclease-3
VNGLRAILSKNLPEVISQFSPDMVCLQEIKLSADDLAPLLPHFPDYVVHASHAERPGYSGVALLVHRSVPWADGLTVRTTLEGEPDSFSREGRILVAETPLGDLYNLYFPSGTSGPERQDFKYQFMKALEAHWTTCSKAARSSMIVCGDFNICHTRHDIHHPDEATRRQLSGFLPEERAWMDRIMALGLHDTYRIARPDERGVYSWWTYRAGARKKNLGWRIDYQLVGMDHVPRVEAAALHPSVQGSDHCPTSLLLSPPVPRGRC